jgi:hypothetical protein
MSGRPPSTCLSRVEPRLSCPLLQALSRNRVASRVLVVPSMEPGAAEWSGVVHGNIEQPHAILRRTLLALGRDEDGVAFVDNSLSPVRIGQGA